MSAPITEHLRYKHSFMKTVAAIVLVTFVSLSLQPLAFAAQTIKTAAPKAEPDSTDKLAKTIEAIEAKLDKLDQKLTNNLTADTEKAELQGLKKQLHDQDETALDDFAKIEKHLQEKKLPKVIIDRHAAALKQFREEMTTLKNNLDDLDKANDDNDRRVKTLKAKEHLKVKQKKRAHTPLDPNNLPFRATDAKKTRKPAQKKEDFQKLGLLPEERIQLASTELFPGMLAVAALIAAPGPADLAPTEDVQITDEIRALATSLANNPVKIYNWVRDNIRFLPTYGSIQGSQMTLMAQQGNAFDNASLLIALLRASGIPARYVYGTVQVPIDQVMNWVGGVTAPEAALLLLGQGGIPNTGLVQGGKFVAAQLEHVWVEAYIDFSPARGAINKQGDAWVPMDGSFKQYRYTPGMDIKTNVPFDAQALLNQIKATAQINEQEGWATGVSTTIIQTAANNYKDEVVSYINTNKPNATVGDVIGNQEIISDNRSVLAATLPYTRVATGTRFAAIPDNLRHKFEFKLYASDIERVLGSPGITLVRSLPSLAGKKVGLSFLPASAGDQAVIDDALARGATRLPAYLIQVKPQLTIDGNIEATGGIVGMGTPQILSVNVVTPWYAEKKDYRIVAGDVSVIGINPASITPRIYTKRIKQFNLAQSTGASSVDEMLFQTHLAYWAEFHAFTQLHAGLFKARIYQLPSHGLTAAPLSAVYMFGLPFSASYKSRSIDIKENVISVMHLGNDADITRQFVRHTGYFSSALESSVFDQLFQLPLGTSMSAVRAISLANEQGIRVYTINQDNINSVLPLLSVSQEMKGEISAATNAGRQTYVPQHNLTHNGFVGAGYIIEDPITGSGTYKIAGGRDGGDSPTQETVQPLPQIPATLGVLFVLGALVRQAGATLLLNGGMLVGIAIPGAGGVIAGVGIIIIAYLLINAFIQTMVDTIDRLYPRTREHYRHFTGDLTAILIVISGVINSSLARPELGLIVYLTKESFTDCPPTSEQGREMARKYEIPRPGATDPSRVRGYVDIAITRSNFWDIRSVPNDSGGIEERVMNAPFGLLLDGFGVEFEKACTALGPR